MSEPYRKLRRVTRGSHDTVHRPRRIISKPSIKCDVCSLTFKSELSLRSHTDYYNDVVDRVCDICQLVCKSRILLADHKKQSACKISTRSSSGSWICNFCRRSFKHKSYLRAHLFHHHGNLVSSSTNESDKTSEVLLSAGTNNHTMDLPTQQTEKTPTSSPRTMRQTTMTEFFSPFGKKSKEKSVIPQDVVFPKKVVSPKQVVSPKKVISPKKTISPKKVVSPKKISVTPRQNGTLINSSNHDCEQNTVINSQYPVPDTNSATDVKPFVQIHVNSNIIMSLLKDEKESEVDDHTTCSTSHSAAYNLRQVTRNDADRSTIDSGIHRIPKPLNKRRRSTITSKRRQKGLQLSEQELKAHFGCKECTVRLERCNKVTSKKSLMVDELQHLPIPEVNVKIERNFENVEQIPKKDFTLKRVEVSLVRVNDLIKVPVNKSLLCPKVPSTPCDTFEVNVREKLKLQCNVCKKSFSLKNNLRKHLKLYHVAYMSSICKARYRSKSKLLKHYLNQHAVSKRKVCCVCLTKLKSPLQQVQHMSLHCIRIIRSRKDNLTMSGATECNLLKKSNRCKACGKHFWLSSCLSQHQTVCRKMKEGYTKMKGNVEKDHALIVKTFPFVSAKQVLDGTTHIEYDHLPGIKYPAPEVSTQFPNSAYSVSNISHNSPASSVSESKVRSRSVANHKSLLKGVAFVKGYNIDATGTDKEKFPCTVCGIQFHTFQNLCLHERTFSKPAVHACEICGTAFTTNRMLQVHTVATHTLSDAQDFKYFCTFCTQGFFNKTSLQIHTGHFHAGQTPIIPKLWLDCERVWGVNTVCNVCNLMFESLDRFIEHKMYYYGGQAFTCTFCNKTFQGMYLFNQHNKLAHYSDDMRKLCTYVCNICNEGFNKESHFHAHKLHVHLNEVSSQLDHTYAIPSTPSMPVNTSVMWYTCDICYMNFSQDEDLQAHKMEFCNDGEYLCSYCPRMFPTNTILMKHERLTHTADNINDYHKCRHCKEVLVSSAALKCHEMHFHNMISDLKCSSTDQFRTHQSACGENVDKSDNGEGNFRCTVCGMRFQSREKLNYHFLEYTNDGAYSCEICYRKFPELYRLEMHKLKHSNLNFILSKHHCPVCREGFASVANVRAHVLHFHGHLSSSIFPSKQLRSDGQLKRRPIKCSECHAKFLSVSTLKKHKLRFINDGKYICEYCGRKFARINLLRQHVKKHTINSQLLKYPCTECDDKFRNAFQRYQHIIHVHGMNKRKSKGTDLNTIQYDFPALYEQFIGDEYNRVSIANYSAVQNSNTGPAESLNLASKCNDELEKAASTVVNSINKTSNTVELVGIVEHLEEKPLYYTCPICSFKYATLKMFQSHFKMAHKRMIEGTISGLSDNTTKNRCESCRSTFPNFPFSLRKMILMCYFASEVGYATIVSGEEVPIAASNVGKLKVKEFAKM
ncbi:PREDICTED: zinc finger protein 423-like [Dufourea novaeangliae]|uniref:zinc finger protein 423-like n=1 Tax=Dufourea novaeangliae TaxID=178035 RepID=UPI000767AABB|nr:PREDICTED: zinc finger protein 423-like [Dufourea novaeangliae]